jgi:hypothetical protein
MFVQYLMSLVIDLRIKVLMGGLMNTIKFGAVDFTCRKCKKNW